MVRMKPGNAGIAVSWAAIVVFGILPGLTAADAGLRKGDVIIAIDDQAIDGRHPLENVLVQFDPGAAVTLTIVRAGTERNIEVELGSRPVGSRIE
jgi:putative serine protease PepD